MATTQPVSDKHIPDDKASASGSTDVDDPKPDSTAATPPSDEKDVERGAHTSAPHTTPSEIVDPPPAKGPAANIPTANDAGSIPDGGLQAWLQVAGGFSLFFNTWGLLNTFGVFQTYYESGQLFTTTSSNIAWIGAIQAFLLLFIGALSGPVFDRGYLRLLICGGSFLVVFGFMMLSLCTEFWQAILAQGFCIGLGGGCLFIPAVAILPTYFRKRLGLAVGLAASGSSMGGVIYPIVFYRLINVNQIGFGWSVRILGFIALVTLIIPCVVMKMRVRPPKARALIDVSAFTDWPFVAFALGVMIGFIGLYVVFFYISFLGEARNITDTSLSFYLVPILNAASVFGRTVPNAISDKVGTLNLIGPGALVCAILVFCLIAVNNVGGLITIAILFGFFSGVFIALPPVCFAILTQDKTKIGTRVGMGFAVIGFAVLIGGPGGGGVLGDSDPENLRWTGLFVFGGVMLTASAIILCSLRVYKAGWKLSVKV